MTSTEVKAIVENNLPANWEYAHDTFVDEAIEDTDIESMLEEGWTDKEIADEVVGETFLKQKHYFEKACNEVFVPGVRVDEDGISISDEYFTASQMEELYGIVREELELEEAEKRSLEFDGLW